MKRRDFLRLAAASSLCAAVPRVLAAEGTTATDWRSYELTYTVDLSSHDEATRVWLPLPQSLGDYQQVSAVTWQGTARNAAVHQEATYGAPIFYAEWDKGENNRQLSVTTRVTTRDRQKARPGHLLDGREQAFYLQPTAHMPVDGIVADTARRIAQGADSPDAKARAIYEWIVDNTFREPTTRGCGLGDIRYMLETNNLGGKCADINSLFVGLARAAGLPAREVYGVRVAESAQFKSLGAAGDISKAHHCRAEYFSPRYGWVAVDPADVRKVVLQESMTLDDPRVKALRDRLFGYWEMNWVGFNFARDFALTPTAREPVPYLMYPYAELGDEILDGRDPQGFFSLTSRPLAG